MDELKKRRLLSAATATAVVLFTVLLISLIWQVAALGVKRAKAEKLQQEIELLEAEKEQIQDEIELWRQDWKIEERARQLKG